MKLTFGAAVLILDKPVNNPAGKSSNNQSFMNL